jgi:hypothetical protein
MVEGAFNKAGKYVRSEPERQTLQAAAGVGGSDPMLAMLYDVLRNIAESNSVTAKNTAYRPLTAQAPSVGKH